MFGERNKLTCMYRRARTVYNDANYITLLASLWIILNVQGLASYMLVWNNNGMSHGQPWDRIDPWEQTSVQF